MSRTTRWQALRRRLPKLLVAGASLLLSLVLAEGVVRAVFRGELSDTYIFPIDSLDQKYHHKRNEWTIPAPNPRAVRILFIGDSFTWGVGAKHPEQDGFPTLVGKFFNEGGVDGAAPRAVQAVNLGMVSYSPSIYGVVLRDYAPVVKPDIVVVGLDDGDPQDDLVYAPMVKRDERGLPVSVYPRMPGVPDILLPVAKCSKLVRLASGILGKSLNKLRRRMDFLRQLENRYGHYRPGPGTDEQWAEAFERSLELTDRIYDYCRDHQIKLVLLNYPYAPAVTTTYNARWLGVTYKFTPGVILDPTFHRAVRDFATARDIAYYDFTPYLRSLSDHSGIYNDENGHYAEKGYELLARELVRFLTPLVDEAAKAKAKAKAATLAAGERPR